MNLKIFPVFTTFFSSHMFKNSHTHKERERDVRFAMNFVKVELQFDNDFSVGAILLL